MRAGTLMVTRAGNGHIFIRSRLVQGSQQVWGWLPMLSTLNCSLPALRPQGYRCSYLRSLARSFSLYATGRSIKEAPSAKGVKFAKNEPGS